MTKVTINVPIRTISEANTSEHWTKKNKRHKNQQFFVRLAWDTHKETVILPCTVTLTRLAPRSLDQNDNLPMALKWITDQVADILVPGKAKGQAESDNRITWHFKQEKATKYSVRIEVEFEGP